MKENKPTQTEQTGLKGIMTHKARRRWELVHVSGVIKRSRDRIVRAQERSTYQWSLCRKVIRQPMLQANQPTKAMEKTYK